MIQSLWFKLKNSKALLKRSRIPNSHPMLLWMYRIWLLLAWLSVSTKKKKKKSHASHETALHFNMLICKWFYIFIYYMEIVQLAITQWLVFGFTHFLIGGKILSRNLMPVSLLGFSFFAFGLYYCTMYTRRFLN